MKLRKTEIFALVVAAAFLIAALVRFQLVQNAEPEIQVSVLTARMVPDTLPSRGEAAEAAPEGKLDLNRVGAEELQTLSGVGEVLAARIVADRNANGPFASVEDLTRVKGIGPKILEANRDRLTVTVEGRTKDEAAGSG